MQMRDSRAMLMKIEKGADKISKGQLSEFLKPLGPIRHH